jgi:hypothetical protein
MGPFMSCSYVIFFILVPVVTACEHSFCGVCFLDLKRAHYNVSCYMLSVTYCL